MVRNMRDLKTATIEGLYPAGMMILPWLGAPSPIPSFPVLDPFGVFEDTMQV